MPSEPLIPVAPARDSLSRTASPSRLEWITIPSSTLGTIRRFGVYFPPGFDESSGFPVLYLFRGHETEWAGVQDGRTGLVKILDHLILTKRVAPMMVVLPGFMAPDRQAQGVPVNWSESGRKRGVGNGRMEDHFFEIKTCVERHLPVRTGKRYCAVDGFSMGGFSSIYIATKFPHLIGSAGAYDGSFMWDNQIDPRRGGGRSDKLWFSDSTAPFFRDDRGRWDIDKMEGHNPIHFITTARGERGRELRRVRFHIRTVGSETEGNIDRARNVVNVLRQCGIRNTFQGSAVVLSPRAQHTWKWADLHLAGTLHLHDRVFRGLDT